MVTLPFYRFHLQSALAAAASHQININITIQELFCTSQFRTEEGLSKLPGLGIGDLILNGLQDPGCVFGSWLKTVD